MIQKLLIILILCSTSLIAGCKTVPTNQIDITPFSELYPIPSRPYLAPIGSEPIKEMGIHLTTLTTHVERLENYIEAEGKYYLQIISITK